MQGLSQLGITGRPSDTSPQGLLVTAFTATTPESPLKTIGVQQGDVILSCNGAQQQMGRRLPEAMKGLQERGEPVTLVVLREGKQITLARKDKLAAAQLPPRGRSLSHGTSPSSLVIRWHLLSLPAVKVPLRAFCGVGGAHYGLYHEAARGE